MEFKSQQKKKKRSFYQTAKRFQKKSVYGRGSSLSEDDYHYYMSIMKNFKEVNGEEKETLIDNFFKELEKEGKVLKLITNQIVSRILDDVLPLAPISRILAFVKLFCGEIRDIATDPYSSFVLQTLLILCYKYSQKNAVCTANGEGKETIAKEAKSEMKDFLLMVSNLVYNNLLEFVTHTSASHIIQVVLQICSGIDTNEFIKRSHKVQIKRTFDDFKSSLVVPKKLAKMIPLFAVRLQQLPDLPAIISNNCGSIVLQTALLVLQEVNPQLRKQLQQHIIQFGLNLFSSSESTTLHSVYDLESTVRILEVMLCVSDPEEQVELYEQYFKPHFTDIVCDAGGNFTVQKLLHHWKDKTLFEEIFKMTSENFFTCMEYGYTGVLHALVVACRRLSLMNGECYKNICGLLECIDKDSHSSDKSIEPALVAQCILYLMKKSDLSAVLNNNEASSLSISYHGSLIVQEFLQFKKPIKMVNSLLSLNVDDLETLCCSPTGSHVIDAFYQSSHVGAKSKNQFTNTMLDRVVQLSCNKHGSRSLEVIWSWADIKLKTAICKRLLKAKNALNENHFGKIIYNKFQVGLFNKNDKSDWEELQQQHKRKYDLLKDLLDGASQDMSKKTKSTL